MDTIQTIAEQKMAIERLEGLLLDAPQMPIKYVHTFAEGVYVREAHVLKGMLGIGHEHRTQTVNVMLKGRMRILAGDSVIEMAAPCVFVSEPGVRKVAEFLEDTIFLNILHNPTNETDLQKLEDLFIIKSKTFLQHESQTSLSDGQAS